MIYCFFLGGWSFIWFMIIWYYRICFWVVCLEVLVVGWRGEIVGVFVWVWVCDDWVKERWCFGEKGFVGLEGFIGVEIGKREKFCRKLLVKWWIRWEDVRIILLLVCFDCNFELNFWKWVWYLIVLMEIYGKMLGYFWLCVYFFLFYMYCISIGNLDIV